MVRLISLLISVLMVLGVMPWTNAMAAASWSSQIPSKAESGATFRFGVLSDSHLSGSSTVANNLDVALAAFSELGDVDAVAMNGDMAYAPAASGVTTDKYVYNGAEVNLPANLYAKVKATIEANAEFTLEGNQSGDVFTADTSAGKPIIYSMGNHEFPENDRDTTRAAASKQLFKEQTGRNDNYIMNVGGYTFIQSSAVDFFNDFRSAEEFVKAQILAAEASDPSNKPIFYLQHEGVHGTVVGSDSSAEGNSEAFKAFLNEHPRVIVLSAHTHAAEEDPRTIWQDGFTAVSTGKVGGGNVSAHGGTYSMGNNTLGSQCLVFDLTEGETKTDVKIYRLNLLTGLLIGEPWEFSIDGTTDTFKYNKDRYENPSIAKFNDDAALTIVKEARQGFKFTYHVDQVSVTPSEDFLQDDFVHSYRVVIKNTDANVIVQNFKVFADIFVADTNKVNSYSVTLPNQLDRATNYEVSVYALTPFTATASLESLEAKGVTPVKYAFKTSEELTDADKSLIRTHENINVAYGKPVYSGREDAPKEMLTNGVFREQLHVSQAGYPAEAPIITLPSGDKVEGATSYGTDWYIVDLGRRYNLKQVKLYPCGSNYGYIARWMQNVAIDASNDITFTEKVTIGSIGSDPETVGVTSNSTPFVVDLSGNTAYRYLRLRRTGVNDYAYGELEVFADVTTQEVSRNRQTEVNFATYSSMGASKTVDGTVNSNSNCWLVESLKSTDPDAPFNLVVDLEQDYPLGFIEMFGRYGSNNPAYRKNWKIYGYTNAQGKPDVNTTDFSDATLLWDVKEAFPQVTNGTNPEGLKVALTSEGKYRYIVFSKYVREAASLGEIRAEIVLPKVSGIERTEANELTISFTEKMDAASIAAEGAISVTSESGVALTPASVTLKNASSWDGGYDVIMTFADSLPSSGLLVNIDGDVKTAEGAAIVNDYSTRLSGNVIEINKKYSKEKKSVNVALNKPVYSASHVQKNAHKLTNGNRHQEYIVPPSYNTNGTVVLPSGDSYKSVGGAESDWFIVDLGERYNVNKVVLYPRNTSYNEGNMKHFEIQVSNNMAFPKAETVVLGGIGASLDGTGITSESTPFVKEVDIDGYYRYVRIKKTAWSYYGYSELEVYADLTATEVSRNAEVKIDEGYTNALGDYATQYVTDGVTDNVSHGALFEGITSKVNPPYNVLVDLGKDYPIGYIEMWGRGDETGGYAATDVYRINWTVYGASSTNVPTCAQDTSKSTAIHTIGENIDAFPASGEKATVAGGLYRYLTFSKTSKNVGALGEIGAYVINPTAYSAVAENGKLTVNFTDKMEVVTMIAENFTLGGVELSNPVLTTGFYGGYTVTFDYDGIIADGMPLVISEKVRNEKGIELAGDQEICVKTVKYTLTVGEEEKDVLVADASHTIKMAVYSEKAADVMIFAAVKSGDTLISCTPTDAVSIAEGEAEYITVSGITPKAGEKVYLYIWEKGTFRPVQAVTVIE